MNLSCCKTNTYKVCAKWYIVAKTYSLTSCEIFICASKNHLCHQYDLCATKRPVPERQP